MRSLVGWKDREVEYPNRYTEVNAGGGTVQITPAPGTVREEGTPQNASNFNTMDLAALEAMLMSAENQRMLMQTQRIVEGLKGLTIDVNMTNSQAFPFNNSVTTVQITEQRNTADYYVLPEVLSSSDDNIGEFKITDKLLNGFKIAYSGSASAVSVRCHVIGGI